MIARILRVLAYLRILRKARDSYCDFARGGALGDSDKPWPPLDDAYDAASRCARGEHRAAGESMPASCADCGVDWSDLDEEPRR